MTTFAWSARVQADLAEEWDLSQAYVADLSREAARQVAAYINNPEYISTLVGQYLGRALEAAELAGDVRSTAGLATAWHRIVTHKAAIDPGTLESDVEPE